jgi:rare lipoprotein A
MVLYGCAGTGGFARQPSADHSTGGHKSKTLPPGTYEVFGKSYRVMPESQGYLEIGIASWYGRDFHGNLTANGEIYDMHELSAAHKSLPLPTWVKVTNLNNQRSILVRVNDRGPFHDDRLIDLSYRAALDLEFTDRGTAPVVVEAIDHLNYPNEAALPETGQDTAGSGESYYLQIGAFMERGGADRLMGEIRQLMSRNALADVQVSILADEDDSRVLHKVWMGPLFSEERREEIVALLQRAELPAPLRVQLD